jgi:L-2-hydroxyglutarate oxidase LhgO
MFYAKGNYFSVGKNLGIKHLIYPIPEGFGLGIHLTLELDHSVKFGPDVQWIDNPLDYSVDENRKDNFIVEIKKYFPSLDPGLLKPSYAGIRPILDNKDKSMRDFVIQDQSIHSIPKLINLYGIESPGLTSSLAIARYVKQQLE